MSEEYFDIIFHNTASDESEKEVLAAKLAEKFHIKEETAARLMHAQQPICLKKKVDLETALKYRSAFNNIGLECELFAHKDDQKEPLVERRTGERRQGDDRREHYRASSVQPDRRMKDRRETS